MERVSRRLRLRGYCTRIGVQRAFSMNHEIPISQRCPHLKLSFANLQDTSELVKLWYQAFESPTIRALWPDTLGVRQWWDSNIRQDMLNKPPEKYLKVIDTDRQGMIVAWVKWSLQTAEQRGSRYSLPWHPDMDTDHNNTYFRELEASRARLVGGKENFYCDMLAVHPDYRRLGLANAMMSWGCQIADANNVPIYLDTTKDCSLVYEKFGFVTRDMSMGMVSMVREPKRRGLPNSVS